MSRRPQLVMDLDAFLDFYPEEGRPDADPELTIYDGADVWSGWVADTSVARASYSQALTADAKRGARDIDVDPTGLVTGQLLMLTTPYMEREVLRVRAHGFGKVFPLDPIHNAQTEVSMLEDHLIRATLLAADLDIRVRGLRAVWSYVIDGVAKRRTTYFDIVRQDWYVPISEDEIEDLYNGWGGIIRNKARHDQAVRGARRELARMIEGWRKFPDLLRDPYDATDSVAWLAIRATLAHNATEHVHRQLASALKTLQFGSAWFDANDNLERGTGADVSCVEDETQGVVGIPYLGIV